MALLDNLKHFSIKYHEYVAACEDLTQKSQKYTQLNKAGAALWYQQSDDALITASRSIEGSIAKAEESIAIARKDIAANNQQAQKIQRTHNLKVHDYDAQLQKEIKKRNRNTIIFALAWIFLIGPLVASITAPLLGVFFFIGGGATSADGVNKDAMLGMTGAMAVMYIITLFIGAIIYAVIQSGNKKKARQAAEEKKISAQSDCKQAIANTQQNSLSKQQQIETIVQQINALKPQATQQKALAMKQAELLWATDMTTRGNEIQQLAETCDRLYEELVLMGTIPREKDWPAIDEVIGKISSGRADDLKEALLLIDADQQHKESMAMMAVQLNEQVNLRKQLKTDLGRLSQQVERTRNEIQRQHSADRAQKERQHAESMRVEAAQLAVQAEMCAEQRKLHDEVRELWE